MISKKQLNSIGYFPEPDNKNLFTVFGSWEYGYDISTQELLFLNDGMNEDVIAKITDFKTLEDLLESYGEIYK